MTAGSPTPDPLAAHLAAVRERSERPVPHVTSLPVSHDGVRTLMESAGDVPRLLAALEAVLALHVQATTWGAGLQGGRFDYCSTCSGHPKWPCPEVQAISRALLGEEAPDAH